MTTSRQLPSLADAARLSTMLELGDGCDHAWRPEELREMARHQWSAPICLGLGAFSLEAAGLLASTSPPLDPQLTLGQLLSHPRPAVPVLRLVKRFAKTCRSDPSHPLPREIVMLLYYASIVAAQRAGEPISELPPDALRRGLAWLCEQSWVQGEMRSLLNDGLSHLDRQRCG